MVDISTVIGYIQYQEDNCMDRKFGKIISFLYRRGQAYLGTALKKYNLTAAEQPFCKHIADL
jgi:hypothetical protein